MSTNYDATLDYDAHIDYDASLSVDNIPYGGWPRKLKSERKYGIYERHNAAFTPPIAPDNPPDPVIVRPQSVPVPTLSEAQRNAVISRLASEIADAEALEARITDSRIQADILARSKADEAETKRRLAKATRNRQLNDDDDTFFILM